MENHPARESARVKTAEREGVRPEGAMPDEARRRILKRLAFGAVAVPVATLLLDGTTHIAMASP